MRFNLLIYWGFGDVFFREHPRNADTNKRERNRAITCGCTIFKDANYQFYE